MAMSLTCWNMLAMGNTRRDDRRKSQHGWHEPIGNRTKMPNEWSASVNQRLAIRADRATRVLRFKSLGWSRYCFRPSS